MPLRNLRASKNSAVGQTAVRRFIITKHMDMLTTIGLLPVQNIKEILVAHSLVFNTHLALNPFNYDGCHD
jgi:hypothetical protein